jgi:hypothetical protein
MTRRFIEPRFGTFGMLHAIQGDGETLTGMRCFIKNSDVRFHIGVRGTIEIVFFL